MNEWISVKDRLPSQGKHVLAYSLDPLNKGCFRAYWSGDIYYPSWNCYPIGSNASDGLVFDITHWMPLPEPPKEDE